MVASLTKSGSAGLEAAGAQRFEVQRLRLLQSVCLLSIQFNACLRGDEARSLDPGLDFIASRNDAGGLLSIKRGVTKVWVCRVEVYLSRGSCLWQTTSAASYDRFVIAHSGCGLGGSTRTINWPCCARCNLEKYVILFHKLEYNSDTCSPVRQAQLGSADATFLQALEARGHLFPLLHV